MDHEGLRPKWEPGPNNPWDRGVKSHEDLEQDKTYHVLLHIWFRPSETYHVDFSHGSSMTVLTVEPTTCFGSNKTWTTVKAHPWAIRNVNNNPTRHFLSLLGILLILSAAAE